MIPAPLFADHALSARIEGADAQLLRECYEAVSARLPERVCARLEVAGGFAPFVGLKISLSRSVGLGMCGPVSDADLDALEEFYRKRDSDTDVGVSPYADPSLFAALGHRGFHLVELDTVLAQPLDSLAPPTVTESDVVVRVAGPDEAAAWVAASLAGFAGTDENIPGEMSATFEAAFHVPTSRYLFASLEGVVIGTAGLDIHAKTANLFGASTLSHARGRGAQSALFRARLALAREAGCDLAFTRTTPGSPSQRNAERHGFRTVYSRARMVKSITHRSPRKEMS
jgi:N-acetylglutamate synthase-like GNAT family acetyltransferase